MTVARDPGREAEVERSGDPIDSLWQRLAPLSTGAVAGGLVIVGATSLLRRALGARYGRRLSWGGALALIPLGLWLFLRDGRAEPDGSADETGEEAG